MIAREVRGMQGKREPSELTLSFFFSSRRRHTRCSRDWSSDVCSSDLGLGENEQALLQSGGWGLIEDLRRDHKVGDFLMAAPEGRGSFFINSADGRDRYSDFFLTELLPFIETHYRVIRERQSRGLTRLSMGGYGALRYAFANPDLFGS